MTFAGDHIWIVGASSGIGRALAVELASQGATLILSARREEELTTLAGELGGNHIVMPFDVAESDNIPAIVADVTTHVPRLDRVIFMAATFRSNEVDAHDIVFAKQLIDINLTGAIALTYALLPVFDKQQSGQLVLCASMGGYTGFPGGQPYSCSKAALINFAESLYAERPDYLDVKLINPGFVRTRITDKNKFHMPLLLEPPTAARAIAKGLQKGAFEIHFPLRFTYAIKLLSSLPYWLKLPIVRLAKGKHS